jgi:hypothetical protein
LSLHLQSKEQGFQRSGLYFLISTFNQGPYSYFQKAKQIK